MRILRRIFFVRRRRGQTMAELLVAVYIILTALVGIAALVTMLARGQRTAEEMVVGMNLAREGLELVRSFRDTAFIQGAYSSTCTSDCLTPRRDYDDHTAIVQTVTSAGLYQPVFNYTGAQPAPSPSPAPDEFSGRGPEVCLFPGYGYYNYYGASGVSCSVGTGSARTSYLRMVQIDYLCLDPLTNDECIETTASACGAAGSCGAAVNRFNQLVGHRAISRVKITGRHGPDKLIELTDYLYAWK